VRDVIAIGADEMRLGAFAGGRARDELRDALRIERDDQRAHRLAGERAAQGPHIQHLRLLRVVPAGDAHAVGLPVEIIDDLVVGDPDAPSVRVECLFHKLLAHQVLVLERQIGRIDRVVLVEDGQVLDEGVGNLHHRHGRRDVRVDPDAFGEVLAGQVGLQVLVRDQLHDAGVNVCQQQLEVFRTAADHDAGGFLRRLLQRRGGHLIGHHAQHHEGEHRDKEGGNELHPDAAIQARKHLELHKLRDEPPDSLLVRSTIRGSRCATFAARHERRHM